jgi:hypothetical protein
MRNVAGSVFGGLVGGGGGGTTGISIGIGVGAFHSVGLAAALWVTVAAGFYTLARTIYSNIAIKREKQLRELTTRLEEQVAESISARASKPVEALPSVASQSR